MIAQEVSRLGERCARIGANVRLVEVEEGVLNFPGEELLDRRPRRRRRRRGRSSDGHANAGVGRAAGASGGYRGRGDVGGTSLWWTPPPRHPPSCPAGMICVVRL